MNSKLHKMVLTALFTALVCVATIIIQIPSPMQGYVNLGDCIILLSAWLLGPLYGFFAGGVGSALADLLTGYSHYAPGTLVIKGLIAVAAALIFSAGRTIASRKHSEETQHRFRRQFPWLLLGGIAGEAIMVLGYFGYAALLLGKGLSAATSIPGNLFQALVGIVAGLLLYPVLVKSGIAKKEQ